MIARRVVRAAVSRARSGVTGGGSPVRMWREFRYRRLLDRMAGPRLLRAFADAYPEAFFVEIGSNDGDKYDHLSEIIRSGSWRGIMIEPVPYVYQRLARNYEGTEGIILENVAIADRDARLPFYHLRQLDDDERGSVPDWYDAIGSFVLDTILSHRDKIPDLERRVVSTEVPCVTFQTLCAKHGVDRVDLILIDTEGYDWQIIKNIDFSLHRPRLLVYEHFHLAPEERVRCRSYLEELGYELLSEGFDTFCLDLGVDDPLSRFWRGLRPAVPAASADTEAR